MPARFFNFIISDYETSLKYIFLSPPAHLLPFTNNYKMRIPQDQVVYEGRVLLHQTPATRRPGIILRQE